MLTDGAVKPALLDGTPAHKGEWLRWPQWREAWEPGVLDVYRSGKWYLQGMAWIDPGSYEIVRLRTDLLMPRPDVGLNRQTTEIRFNEVQFENISRSIWLPKEVIVTIEYQSQFYRNKHRH